MKQFFLIPLFQYKEEIIKIDKNVFRIGRDSTNDCYILDESISRKHIILTINGNDDEIYIEDNNSANGVFVNDEKINNKTKLKNGDLIRLSNFVFQLSSTLPEKILFYEGFYKVDSKNIEYSESFVNYLLSEKELIDIISTMLLKYNDVEKIFQNILNYALKMLKSDRGVLLTKENNKFKAKVSANIADEFNSINTLSKSIVDYVIENKKPVIINNPAFNARFMGKSLLQFQIESVLCSPIYIGDEIVAVLYIDNREEKKQFTTFEYALFLSFISHCQNILFNAKKNEKLLEDLMAQSVVSRWDEINRVKEKVVTQFNENIIKPLNVLTKEMDTIKNEDEILNRFKKTYKEVVNNIDSLNINIDIDKEMAILTTINFKSFINNIIEEVDDYLKLNDISTIIDGNDIFLEIFKVQLGQVIKNLILFLIKILSRGSEIKIFFNSDDEKVFLNIEGIEKSDTINKETYFQTKENKKMLEMVENLLKGMNCNFQNIIEDNCIKFQFELLNKYEETKEKPNIGEKTKEHLVLISINNKNEEKKVKKALEKANINLTNDFQSVENVELIILEIGEENFEKHFKNCSTDCKKIILVEENNKKLMDKVKNFNPYMILEIPISSEKLLDIVKIILSVTDAEKRKIKEIRNSLVKDLVATMKHEINNPLQIINMNLELIENNENKHKVDKIKQSAKRIGELIENLSTLNDFQMVKYANSNRNIITPKK